MSPVIFRAPCSDRSPVIVRSASKVSSTSERRNLVESRLSSVSALPPVETTPVTPSFASTVKGTVWLANAAPTPVTRTRNCSSVLSGMSLPDPVVNVSVCSPVKVINEVREAVIASEVILKELKRLSLSR